MERANLFLRYFFSCGHISNYFSIVMVQKFLIYQQLRQRLRPLSAFHFKTKLSKPTR